MFSDSIDSKINKIKANFDNYLNDKKKDSSAQPPMPSIRRPEQMPQSYVAGSQGPGGSMTTSMAPGLMQPNKPVELEIKQLIIQGKTLDRQPLTLKNIQKEKTINIFYMQEQVRFRLEIKVLDNNLELKINQEKATIQFSFRRATRYRFVKPQSGQPKWMTINNELKDDKLILICNKDGKLLKSSFEGIVPDELIKVDAAEVKTQERQRTEGGMQREQLVDLGDDVVAFGMPTAQQFTDTQKFRKALKDMKEEEKNLILMDIFKIKKQYDDPTQIDRRRLKCPIHSCQKVYRQISQLKTHMKKHPELIKHGIQLTDYGTFEFSSKAMDLALFLGKLYPFEMKKIIKKMKAKQIAQ